MKKPTESGKIVKNATWLIACKVVQSLLSFVIGTLSARYLGPGNYGIIDYAAAIVSFMVPVVQLGLRSTLVHEIIAAPDSEGKTLGTSLFMSTATSFLGIFGVIAFTAIANPNDPETMLVCALYSISLVFQATEILQYWFQAKLLSKYIAITSLAAYVVVSAYRCFLLITQKSVYWFAFSQALDYLLISASLYGIYRRISKQRLTVSFPLAKQLFKRSRYYIVSGIMVTFFSLTDRVMITLMLGKEANGYYSAAVSCAALSQFVFAAIVDKATDTLMAGVESSCAECAQKHNAACAIKNAGFIDGTQLSKIQNMKPSAANTSGCRGVSFNKKTLRWEAQIKFRGKRTRLGSYKNFDDAVLVRKKAEQAIFGEFLDSLALESKKDE